MVPCVNIYHNFFHTSKYVWLIFSINKLVALFLLFLTPELIAFTKLSNNYASQLFAHFQFQLCVCIMGFDWISFFIDNNKSFTNLSFCEDKKSFLVQFMQLYSK